MKSFLSLGIALSIALLSSLSASAMSIPKQSIGVINADSDIIQVHGHGGWGHHHGGWGHHHGGWGHHQVGGVIITDGAEVEAIITDGHGAIITAIIEVGDGTT